MTKIVDLFRLQTHEAVLTKLSIGGVGIDTVLHAAFREEVIVAIERAIPGRDNGVHGKRRQIHLGPRRWWAIRCHPIWRSNESLPGGCSNAVCLRELPK